jgi:hypothetical protein
MNPSLSSPEEDFSPTDEAELNRIAMRDGFDPTTYGEEVDDFDSDAILAGLDPGYGFVR